MRAATLVLLASLAGCRDNQDATGARELWAKAHADAGFRAWRRAPGYPGRQPSFTAHADAVEIFVNPVVGRALEGPEPVATWPEGSIVVKEGFSGGGSRALVAMMEKRPSGWFWAEFDDDGDPLFSGSPKVCIECHDNRATTSDWVYSFGLPR